MATTHALMVGAIINNKIHYLEKHQVDNCDVLAHHKITMELNGIPKEKVCSKLSKFSSLEMLDYLKLFVVNTDKVHIEKIKLIIQIITDDLHIAIGNNKIRQLQLENAKLKEEIMNMKNDKNYVF